MRLASLACIAAIVSCSRAPEDPTTDASAAQKASPPSSEAPPTIDCAALFAPPAGANKLCDEHVLAEGSEIHWQSYEHAEARYELFERYREGASKCDVGLVSKPPLTQVVEGNRRLALYDADGGGFPTCSVAPSAGRKTVVVISEKHDRPK